MLQYFLTENQSLKDANKVFYIVEKNPKIHQSLFIILLIGLVINSLSKAQLYFLIKKECSKRDKKILCKIFSNGISCCINRNENAVNKMLKIVKTQIKNVIKIIEEKQKEPKYVKWYN